MALTAEKKTATAKRIYKLATEKYGIRPSDLIFDALPLPISTGQEEYRTAGIETLNAIKRIKQELPEVKTILGVSNISFGLNTYGRRVLNRVFMKEAVDNGLDMAIVNYAKIYPLYKIPEIEADLARKLIYFDKSAAIRCRSTWGISPGWTKTSSRRRKARLWSRSLSKTSSSVASSTAKRAWATERTANRWSRY